MKAHTAATADSAAQQTGSGRVSWDGVLFVLVSVLTLFARFRNPALLLGSYQDDFFYYLQVAKYIATTGRSTFNGLYLTNGYHPLWMGVLVCLYRLFHGTAFFVALQVVSLLAAGVTYVLLTRTLRLLLPGDTARSGAFFLGMEALLLIRYGMEVTATLPLAMLLLYLLLRDGVPTSFWRSAGLGLLASLVILSRLDAGLLVALLCLAVLLPRLRTGLLAASIVGFLCGVLPLLLLYFAMNVHVFHLLTPVSGLAKQMKYTNGFSPETWRSLLPTDRMRRFVLLPELALVAAGALGAVLPAAAPRRIPPEATTRHVLAAILVFPVLHLALLSFLSDWTVWPWYFYSVTLAAVAAFTLLAQRLPQRLVLPLVGMYAAVLVLYAGAYAWRGPSSVTVYQSSLELARYMDAHPGVYLMGDQAGTAGYLSHQPIIQTEGLVMDKGFLRQMRAATPLPQVVQQYHADFYARIGGAYNGACLHLAEPANAGPGSPRMRGQICQAPLAIFYREADHMPIRVFPADAIRPD